MSSKDDRERSGLCGSGIVFVPLEGKLDYALHLSPASSSSSSHQRTTPLPGLRDSSERPPALPRASSRLPSCNLICPSRRICCGRWSLRNRLKAGLAALEVLVPGVGPNPIGNVSLVEGARVVAVARDVKQNLDTALIFAEHKNLSLISRATLELFSDVDPYCDAHHFSRSSGNELWANLGDKIECFPAAFERLSNEGVLNGVLRGVLDLDHGLPRLARIGLPLDVASTSWRTFRGGNVADGRSCHGEECVAGGL